MNEEPSAPPARPRLRPWPVFLAILATWALSLFASIWVFALMSLLMPADQQLPKGAPLLALGVGANAVVFTAASMFLARLDASPDHARARLGLVSSTIVDHLLAIIGLLGLTTALDAIVQATGFHEYGRLAEMRGMIAAIPIEERLPLAFVIGVGAGIPEELFFRGYALRRLAAVQHPMLALLFSSAAFGIVHLDPLHAPLAAMMGLFLGFVVLRTGSVFPAISAHIVNNMVATLTAGLALPDWASWPMILAGSAAAAFATFAIIRGHRGEAQRIVW